MHAHMILNPFYSNAHFLLACFIIIYFKWKFLGRCSVRDICTQRKSLKCKIILHSISQLSTKTVVKNTWETNAVRRNGLFVLKK